MKSRTTGKFKIRAAAFTLAALAALLLAACTAPATPTADPAALQQAIDARVTELARMTQTAYVSPTPTLLPPAPIEIPTPAPTAYLVDFTGFEIYTAFLAGGKTQVSILVPNGIQGDYTAKIADKDFSCFSYMMKGKARLICVGPALPHGTYVDMSVFPKGSPVSIFEHRFVVPY